MKRIKGHLHLIFLIFFHLHSLGQAISPHFYKRIPVKTINYEQGLLNNATTGIITDVKGFTWVSTKTGMQRYNGYELQTINPVVNDETIHINSPVYFFAQQNGLIWISYKNGVLEYNPHTNAFRKIINLPHASNRSFSIIPVNENREGIWCFQEGEGLVTYSPSGRFLKIFPEMDNSFVGNVFSQQLILKNTSFTANQNAIFVYNGKDRIQSFNINTHQVEFFETIGITCFVCTETRLFTASKIELESIKLSDKKTDERIQLGRLFKGDISSTSISYSDSNRIFISLNNHLFELDSLLNKNKEFSNLNREPLLQQGFVNVIYADRFNRIWLLTNDDIKRLQFVDFPFEHYIYPRAINNFVRCIYLDEKKHLLLAGCNNGGIQLYDSLGNTQWQKPVISKNAEDINSIEKLTDSKYLIVTFGKGWYILDLPSKRISTLSLNNQLKEKINYRNNNFMSNLQRINDSLVYISTSTNVYSCIFNKEKLNSVKPLLPSKKTIHAQINCFLKANNGSLWAGAVSGVIYKTNEKDSFQIIQIPGNYDVRCFAEGEYHNIWIGTDKGLYIYSPEGKLIKEITSQSGLLNDCIYAILPVKNKAAVFASSNMGISYIPLNGSIINYTKKSGLQDNEFNTESATLSASGKYFFGGINGITAFYPSALSEIKDTPVINITQLGINETGYNFFSKFWRNDSILLNYDQNHIRFDVAALGLLNPDEYVYHYRIKGFEEKYQTTNQPTGIKYVLPPGIYHLQINCSPIFSSLSIFKKSITIIISPPWWQKGWIRIVFAIFLIAMIAFIVRQYLHYHYQRRIRALQIKQEIQEERERISRDLHDNLGAYAAAIASNVANINNGDNENNQTILKQLKNNSQSIISQLSATIWALNKEEISLTNVSDRFKVFIQKIQPNHPNININFKENIKIDQVLLPTAALHLFRIMQEAVNNAIKHSEGSVVTISIISEKSWTVTISDNGRGIAPGLPGTEGGNGLKNMKMRAKQSGWVIQWQKNTPEGTSVIISTN